MMGGCLGEGVCGKVKRRERVDNAVKELNAHETRANVGRGKSERMEEKRKGARQTNKKDFL